MSTNNQNEIKEINDNIKNLLNFLNTHDHYFKEIDKIKLILEELRINLNDHIDKRVLNILEHKFENINKIENNLNHRFNTFVMCQEDILKNVLLSNDVTKKDFKEDILEKVKIYNNVQDEKIKSIENKLTIYLEEKKIQSIAAKQTFFKSLIGILTTISVLIILYFIDKVFDLKIFKIILDLR